MYISKRILYYFLETLDFRWSLQQQQKRAERERDRFRRNDGIYNTSTQHKSIKKENWRRSHSINIRPITCNIQNDMAKLEKYKKKI